MVNERGEDIEEGGSSAQKRAWQRSRGRETISPDLDALAAALGPSVLRDEPLARHTAMRVGGPADLLIVCESTDEVVRAVELARPSGVDWRLLGGGCNVLVADSGVRGLVIVNRAARIEFGFAKDEEQEAARAEAGAQLSVLARETVERGLKGLEWAAGLPGTVGGAVVGNALSKATSPVCCTARRCWGRTARSWRGLLIGSSLIIG
jgi:FAD/FMN-containing dehydrogenase